MALNGVIMAKTFMDENFLLETETARSLFNAVKDQEIFDYHCHLAPSQIAGNINMKDLTEAWLSGDHYKWRMMRAMGIDEKYITGNGESYDKFLAWTKTIEKLIGNPLYHWTHLELQRYFGITAPLTEKSAPSIWKEANAMLKLPELSVKGIFNRFKIYAVGTTDDPADSLQYHKEIAEGTAPIGKISAKVIPSFRPDRALDLNSDGFAEYVNELSKAGNIKIKTVDDLISVLEQRLDHFIKTGCRSSDHALEYPPVVSVSGNEIENAFKKALRKEKVSINEADSFKARVLTELSCIYAKKDIIMQLHFSALRNVNSKMLNLLGANTGYDAVHDNLISANLAALLDELEKKGLPKTIFYSLNPKDYYPLATIMGGFQNTGVEGKMQLGSAWWFCDHRDGMEEQMRVLANVGMLGAFIGMLTDSRSFLSYPRHEYFRRILCNMIGKWVENGEYPNDMNTLTKIVKDISFENARRYFN